MNPYSALQYLPHLRRINRFLSDPLGTQERLLRRQLEMAQDTEWGVRLGFRDILASDDLLDTYRACVPLSDYEAYREDVRRARRGEADVFWPGQIRHFAVSSGTASAGKIIPLSLEMLEASRRFSLSTALVYAQASRSLRFLTGRLLSVPGRIEEDKEYPGTWVGEVSGLMYLFAPALIKRFSQAVGEDILFLPRWEDKLQAMVCATVDMDIRSIAMVPSWAVVLFPMLIEEHNRRTGAHATTVQEVWPNLTVFFSGAVALSSYLTLLREQVGSQDMDFIESYGASEGFFSFQNHASDSDMLLHLDNGVFYEFVRVGDDSSGASRCGLADVEIGIRYSIHVTSCSGFWSYAVGDIVKFTSLEPFRIVVAGRTSEMLDLYGEAVFGGEARAALRLGCEATGDRFRDYHISAVAPSGRRAPRHQWFIEFDHPPEDIAALATAIDTYLQDVNRHYVIRRECGAFEAPEIIPLPPGTFLRWLRATRGRIGAQTKVPRMSEERNIAEGILKSLETNTVDPS
jgi:GH3 auxin-responsive promoter